MKYNMLAILKRYRCKIIFVALVVLVICVSVVCLYIKTIVQPKSLYDLASNLIKEALINGCITSPEVNTNKIFAEFSDFDSIWA